MIVDEFTGRLMPGRRWSDGLHGAVEAKEGVTIERETQTLATITIQNYFRLYAKLAGMTGTAETEATEFENIYKLGVIVIPTNQPCVRTDENDVVYKTRREKYNAIIDEIEQLHRQGRPSLVGTVSVEASEVLSRMLKRKAIPHTVLNAKYHQSEAEIVARAGHPGAVTIATNMAGRGTDIKLGPGVKQAGGLAIIGTERHESRRVDRQLRGRAGRQGDPGSWQEMLSLDDNIMSYFPLWILHILVSFCNGSQVSKPLQLISLAFYRLAQQRISAKHHRVRNQLLKTERLNRRTLSFSGTTE